MNNPSQAVQRLGSTARRESLSLCVTGRLTIAFRALNVADGKDETHPTDYRADAGDPGVKDLSELLDEGPEPARS